MKIVFAVFVGWAMFLMGLHFGRASSFKYNRQEETGLAEEVKGEKRACPGVTVNARTTLMEKLIKKVTGRPYVCNLYLYGCWCGNRGHGKYVDNFDYCCKVHDFCEDALLKDPDKCNVVGGDRYRNRKFKYNKRTNKCSPMSAYVKGRMEDKKCRRARCLCDMEMVRCMGHYKNEIDTTKVLHQQCNITGSPVCNTKADVIVLIQDSQGISSATVGNIKTVVKKMLTQLKSESTNFQFAVAKYATLRRIGCFGTTSETISYIDNEYQHGGIGFNLLKLALSKLVLKQFDNRPAGRKTDTAKILVIFSDGNTMDENGDIMDTFMLEKTAKLLRVDNNIKIAGVLIPNTEKAPRIQELKGIVTEPDDAMKADFSANLDNIADFLASRVKRLVGCLVKYTVKVYTPDAHPQREYELTVRIKGQREQQTEDHVLYEITEVRQNNLHVIVSEFYDLDVGTVKKIEIKPKRIKDSFFGSGSWNLKDVEATKGGETFTAVFKETISEFAFKPRWYSARAWLEPYPTYSVEIYTPDTKLQSVLRLTVRIVGEDYVEAGPHILVQPLSTPETEKQGDELVFKGSFVGRNVGTMKGIWIKPETTVNWTLKKAKVTKGGVTKTAVVDDEIRAWSDNWEYGVLKEAGASNPQPGN